MTVLVGWNNGAAASGELIGVGGNDTTIVGRYGTGAAGQADGTPDTVHFMLDSTYGVTDSSFRVMLYEQTSRELVAYSAVLNDADFTYDVEQSAPVTAVKDVVTSTAYIVTFEADKDGSNVHFRADTSAEDKTQGKIGEGGATSGYTQDLQASPDDPLPSWDSTSGSNQETFYAWFSGSSGTTPGLRHTLKDTDTGNLQTSLTGLQVMAFRSVPANPVYQATDGTTDGSGVYELNEPTINLNTVTGESLGTTDGSGNLSATIAAAANSLFDSAEESSFTITVGTETITDDGSGNLTGDASATGTIDYALGDISISGAAADTSASSDHQWRQTEIFLTLTDSAGENVAAAWMSVVDLNTSNESVIRTGA